MSDFFYRNPRLLILVICLILVSGLAAFVSLPRMEDPILSERVATINTIYPGADAERVEALVTDPIEKEIREIEEVHTISSSSRFGISTISVELHDSVTEVDEVWSRVRSRLSDAANELPSAALSPRFRRLDMKAYAKIFALAWEQDDVPNYAILRRNAEVFKNELLAVSGTEKVRLFGDPDEEFIVTLDPGELSSLGLTITDVSSRLRQSDAKLPAGSVRNTDADVLLQVGTELTSVQRVGQTPLVTDATGDVVRLQDVADIAKGISQPPSSLAFIDGLPSVALGVLVENGHRIDVWSEEIETTTAKFAARLPKGISLKPIFDQNIYVESRLSELMGNLVLGAVGVMLVILLLMGWRSAVIVGVALPLSALMVLGGLRLLEVPIHQMSVTGLIIALGLLIDNAIVMVDEVSTSLKRGNPPQAAVSATVKHLALPLLGSTVTTALAFAPIALMAGPAGEFVGSIAVSVILSIFSSLFLAMTVVPAFTAWGIRYQVAPRNWWAGGIQIDSLREKYALALRRVLATPAIGIASGVALPILGFLASTQLPEQFFPPADRDQFQIEVELPAEASLQQTTRVANDIRDVLLRDERVTNVHWFLGESAPSFYYNIISRRQNTANYGQALVQLSSPRGATKIIRDFQDSLDQKFPSTRLLVRQLEQGPPFDAPVEIRVFGPDLEELRRIGDEVRYRLASLEHVLHTQSDLMNVAPKWNVAIDEEAARLAGLSHSGISQQLAAALEGQTGGTVLEATEELPVRIRVAKEQRGTIDDISSLDLQRNLNPMGVDGVIPLSAISQVTFVPETATISRRNTERLNEIKAYTTAGVLPATVVSAFQESLVIEPIALPSSYRIALGGEAAERDDAVGSLFASVGILAVLMVATLVISFGSFRLAGIIACVAALSLGLGFAALWVFGYPFGFMAIIGSMGLMGVAINDAIVVLAGIRADAKARVGDAEAVEAVVMTTTRHIVATSLTTMAGFAPLILGGGGFWPPMAVAISGGVLGATVLALFFVPAAYVALMCGTNKRATTEPTDKPFCIRIPFVRKRRASPSGTVKRSQEQPLRSPS